MFSILAEWIGERLRHGRIVGRGEFEPVREEYESLVEKMDSVDVTVTDNYHFLNSRYSMPTRFKKEGVNGSEALEFADKTIAKLVSGMPTAQMPFNYRLREKEGSHCLILSASMPIGISSHVYEVKIEQRR